MRSRLASDVTFILVAPQHPGNVGAVARAMKNFGLRRLAVVDPPPSFDMERARWMAPGADDVLAEMLLVPTLDEALEGHHIAVATTARHRSDDQPVWEPSELANVTWDLPEDAKIAVLFGREDMGLAREQVLRCGAILRIPTDHHASLNLGQAALLVANALFERGRQLGLQADGRMLGGRSSPRPTSSVRRAAEAEERADLVWMEPAIQELVTLLHRVGYMRGTSPEKVSATLREALQRATPSKRNINSIRGVVSRVSWALDHPDRAPGPTTHADEKR